MAFASKQHGKTQRVIWRQLSHAMPAVILGTLFNALDAVSTGLLVFPPDDAGTTFGDVQIQGMSMYIMSTLVSQIVMTLGGSRFAGALGAMLIEILPFLRGIASDIRKVLGEDNPSLVPTVFTAYALTSILIGSCFIILGLLQAGRLVSYFPQTVLVGTIGAIGVSLFILGLGLPFPTAAGALTLSNAGHKLFSTEHLPLLVASLGPALGLSLSMRSEALQRWSRGFTQNAYYTPVVLLLIPAIFWMTVAGMNLTNAPGLLLLGDKGWLFQVERQRQQDQSGLGTDWIYWRLFDFSRVEWHSIGNAATNLVLVVVIGVLNLPIFVPALGTALDESFIMDHELLGQGVANILAGCAGAAPNILQLSYSVFFTKAGGGRTEASVVIVLTLVLLFVAPRLLPYVPTILASALVLFLGVELTLEAVWEAARTMLPTEYLVVLSTLVASTFMGFAPGFGVGIGAALLVYVFWRAVDAHAKRQPFWPRHFRAATLLPSVPEDGSFTENSDQEKPRASSTVVTLRGYVFFGKRPILEKMLDQTQDIDVTNHLQILDLTHAHRMETSALQLIIRRAKEKRRAKLVLCGVEPFSGVHYDFSRVGAELTWPETQAGMPPLDDQIHCFASQRAATEWLMAFASGCSAEKSSEDPDDRGIQQAAWDLDRIVPETRISGSQINIAPHILSTTTVPQPQRQEPNSEQQQPITSRRILSLFRLDPGAEICGQRNKSNTWLVVKGQLMLERVDARLTRSSRLATRALVWRGFEAAMMWLHAIILRETKDYSVTYATQHICCGGLLVFDNAQAWGGRGASLVCTASERVRAYSDGPCWLAELSNCQADTLESATPLQTD